MFIGKLKHVVSARVYATLLGISGVHADTAPQSKAEVAADDAWAFKLTPSYYVTTHEKDAIDLNLRANYGAHAVWLGYYRRVANLSRRVPATNIRRKYLTDSWYPHCNWRPTVSPAVPSTPRSATRSMRCSASGVPTRMTITISILTRTILSPMGSERVLFRNQASHYLPSGTTVSIPIR